MGKRELKYGKIRGWLCRLVYTFMILNILSLKYFRKDAFYVLSKYKKVFIDFC